MRIFGRIAAAAAFVGLAWAMPAEAQHHEMDTNPAGTPGSYAGAIQGVPGGVPVPVIALGVCGSTVSSGVTLLSACAPGLQPATTFLSASGALTQVQAPSGDTSTGFPVWVVNQLSSGTSSTVTLGPGTAVVGHFIDDTLAAFGPSAPLSVLPTQQLALVASSAVIGHVIDDTLAAATAAAPLNVKPTVQLPLVAGSAVIGKTSGVPGATTILSGTITTGGTFQSLQAATARNSIELQNNSTDTCYLYLGPTASATLALSMQVKPGGFYARYAGFIPSDNIAYTCPTAGDVFYGSAQ